MLFQEIFRRKLRRLPFKQAPQKCIRRLPERFLRVRRRDVGGPLEAQRTTGDDLRAGLLKGNRGAEGSETPKVAKRKAASGAWLELVLFRSQNLALARLSPCAQNAVYVGYMPTTPLITRFWNLVESMAPTLQRRLITFITGAHPERMLSFGKRECSANSFAFGCVVLRVRKSSSQPQWCSHFHCYRPRQ